MVGAQAEVKLILLQAFRLVRHRAVLASRRLRWTQFPKVVYPLMFDLTLFLWTFSHVSVPGF